MVHILFLAHGAPGNLFNMGRRMIGLQKGARLAEIRLYDIRVPDDEKEWWLDRLGAKPSHDSPGNPLGEAAKYAESVGLLLGYEPVEGDVGKLGPKEAFNPYVYCVVIGVKKDALIRGAEII